MPTSIVIIDDHEIVRHGLVSLFKDSPVKIVAEAADAEAGVKAVRKHKPDVVLLDVRLGEADGLEAIKRIRSASAETRVVVLSAFDNPTYIALRPAPPAAMTTSSKTASRAEILEAIANAAAGKQPSLRQRDAPCGRRHGRTRRPS